MASYVSNPLTFSPYVSQMPLIQERSIVGREKQAKYEEGVQRIQSSIDNVAGLDVFRPVDKQYLQSKLDELGNNLKTVAAGDFSNFQLVNSVGGMVKSIANDKVLLDKVSDTMKYRKDLERNQNDVKEGKDNPANTLDFQVTSSNWLNGDLNSSYSGRYLTPRDVWKKIKDVAASIGVNSEDVQNIFQTDSFGNPVYREVKDKTGKVVGKEPIFNDIAVQKITKGKDPEAMLRAFQNALTPDDFQQLSIDGKYRYANYSPEELKVIVSSQYEGHIRENKNRLTNVELQITAEKDKGGNADAEKLSQLEKLKQYYEQADLTYKTTRDKNLEMVDVDPGTVRGSLYTSSYLETMSKALSPKETTIKYEESPTFKIRMRVEELNETLKQRAIENGFRQQSLDIDKENLKLRKKELELKTLPPKAPTNLTVPVPVDDVNAALQIEDKLDATVKQSDEATKQLALAEFARLPENSSLSDEKLEEKFNMEADKEGQGTSPAARRKNYTLKKALEAKKLWEENGIPQGYEGMLADYNRLDKSAKTQAKYIEDVEKQALRNLADRGINVQSTAELKKKIKPVSVKIDDPTSPTGWKIIYLEKDDVLNFAKNDDESEEALSMKFGKDLSAIKKKITYPKIESRGAYYSTYMETLPEIKEAQKLLANQNYKELKKEQGAIYKKDGSFSAPTSIAVGNWEEKESGLKRNNVMDQVIDAWQGENDMEDYDGEKMKEIISGDDSRLTLTTLPGTATTDTKYIAQVTSKDGKNSAKMYINAEQYSLLARTTPPSQTEKNDVAIMLEGRSITGEDNYDGAYIEESEFPFVDKTKYSVKGNYKRVKNGSGDTGEVLLRLYVKDKQKGGDYIPITVPSAPIPLIIPGGGYNPAITTIPSTIDDNLISRLIKGK